MTAEEKDIRNLAKVPIFAEIPQDALVEIGKVVEKRVVPSGTLIFGQGDPGDSLYIIDAGRARVFKKGEEGVETELSQLGPGDSFGEMALFTGEARSANVEAVEETHLAVITSEQFDYILKNHPHVSYAFLKQMSKWLVRGETRLATEAQRQYSAPKLAWADFLLILGLSVICALIFNQTNPNGIPLLPKTLLDESITTISLSSAMAQHEKGETLFVDAMPSTFYNKEHIAAAVNIPLSIFDIMYMMALSQEDKEKEIVVYGRTLSKRYDEKLASKLALRGHQNVRILKGGVAAWKKMGYPVEP
jgi:CRP-like cAMP-binding protein/rhodanese-related sulfurtransferase